MFPLVKNSLSVGNGSGKSMFPDSRHHSGRSSASCLLTAADSVPCAGFSPCLKMGRLRHREVRLLSKALTAFLTLDRLIHITVFTCVYCG